MHVSITRVTFPKPGGKFGNITSADGSTVWVPPNLMGMFQVGMDCEIGTQTQTWGRGTPTERLVEVATTGPGGQGQAPPYQAQAPQRNAQAPRQGFQPTVYQGGGQAQTNPQRSTYVSPDKDPRNMYIMGIVGRAMGSGKFAASEITVLTQSAIEAWDRLVVAKAQTNTEAAIASSAQYAAPPQLAQQGAFLPGQAPDPPSDEIPF